jgi:hypothetical protein
MKEGPINSLRSSGGHEIIVLDVSEFCTQITTLAPAKSVRHCGKKRLKVPRSRGGPNWKQGPFQYAIVSRGTRYSVRGNLRGQERVGIWISENVISLKGENLPRVRYSHKLFRTSSAVPFGHCLLWFYQSLLLLLFFLLPPFTGFIQLGCYG